MAILGANYPLDLLGTDSLELYGSPVTARPPDYPTLDGMRLRDTAARQKIRLELVNNAGRTQDEFGYGVWVKRTGNPTGTAWIEWGYSANPSTPPASYTVSAYSVNVEDLSDERYSYLYFSDTHFPLVSPTQQYVWIVLNGTFAISPDNHLIIASELGGGYGQYNGSAWTVAGDYVVGGESFTMQEKQFTVGQVFYAGESLALESLRVGLKRVGSPVGTVWLEVLPVLDSQSAIVFYEPEYERTVFDNLLEEYVTGPNLVKLGSSRRVNLSSVPTTFTEVSFEFDLPPTLEFHQRYAFVIKTDAELSLTNNLTVAIATGDVEYTEGTLLVQPIELEPSGGGYRLGFGVVRFEAYYTENSSFGEQIVMLGEPPSSCNDMRNWLTDLVATLKTYFPAVIPEAYGGTGESVYSKGDILYANQANNLTRLAAGSAAGMTLTLDSNLLPTWAKNGGQVLESLANENGQQIDPGDVLIWSPVSVTPPGAVTYSNTPQTDDIHFCGVAIEPIVDGERGFVCTQGIVQVRITGSCALGDYLGLSHISRRAISYGTHPGPMRALEAGTDGELVYAYIDTGKVDTTPAGSTVVWWTTTPPPGWLVCAGQTVLRAAFPKLFSIIGTQFGIGDGTTTFNLPDLRDRTVIGLSNVGTGSAGRVTTIADAVGATGGAERHTLTLSELPSHRHLTGNTADDGSGSFGPTSPDIMTNTAGKNTSARYTDYAGGGAAHNNMQPSLRGVWIIKVV